MIFTDYPGHLVAVVLAAALVLLVLVAFGSSELHTPQRRAYRRLLTALHGVVVLSLLVILWDPSAWQTRPVFGANTVLAIFDTSASMSLADDGRVARLDKALDQFTKRLAAPGGGPEYRICGFDSHAYHCGAPELLKRWGARSELHEAFSLIASSGGGPAPTNPAERPDTLAGAIIFTDGQAQDRDPRRYPPLPREGLPILLVGVGSRRPHADIAVKSLSAPAGAWVDTAFTATVAVAAANVLNEAVTLELLCDGKVVESRQLRPEQFGSSLRAGPREATAEFVVPAAQLGTLVLTARAKPCRGEMNLANNSRSTSVEVTQERALQVLLYSQWANFDIGKIRQALTWDKRIDLDLVFDVIKDQGLAARAAQSAGQARFPETREEFYQYDVIILGPCDLGQLTPAQRDGLYSFVADRGGGLLLLPGRTVASLAGWREERAEALLPVLFGRGYPRLWPPRPDAIRLTFEAQVGGLFEPNAFTESKQPLSAYHEIAGVKPASMTLATAADVPLVVTHRLGRGHVCLLNAAKLFLLYREDHEGGALSELLCGLAAYLGRTPARGAGLELFAERTAEDPGRIAFSAYVVDKTFQPVAAANVLLTVGEQTVSMEPTGRGYYRTTLDWGPAQAVVATVQAESNGSFLGERTIAASLPPVQDEMSCVDLDEPFLQALARRTAARYLHLDEMDDETARLFVPKHQVGVTETIRSIWPRWPMFLVLCLLLSAGWFIRRAIGLV